MCSGRAQAVLPLGGAVLPLSTAETAQRERKHEFLVPSGSSHGSSRGSTAPSGSTAPKGGSTAPKGGSKKLLPLLPAVLPLQPFQNTKTATTSSFGLRIR